MVLDGQSDAYAQPSPEKRRRQPSPAAVTHPGKAVLPGGQCLTFPSRATVRPARNAPSLALPPHKPVGLQGEHYVCMRLAEAGPTPAMLTEGAPGIDIVAVLDGRSCPCYEWFAPTSW